MKFFLKTMMLFLGVAIISCSNYGEKLEFNGTEVYYKNGITKQEAEQLGEYLVVSEFADEKKKSVQITRNKENNNYVFRMVTSEEFINNKTYEVVFRHFGKNISDSVFNKKPVDFELTDNTFTTKKEFLFKDFNLVY